MPEYLNITTRGNISGTDTQFTLYFQGLPGINPSKNYSIKVIELEYPNNPTYTSDVRPIMQCDQSAPIVDNIYIQRILYKSPFPSGTADRIYCNSTNTPPIIRPLIEPAFKSISISFEKNDGSGPYEMTDYVSILFEIDEM